jgi:hypothetical protein
LALARQLEKVADACRIMGGSRDSIYRSKSSVNVAVKTPRKRLKALEAKVAREGVLLTEAQVVAHEKGQPAKEAHGEFERECPRLLVA